MPTHRTQDPKPKPAAQPNRKFGEVLIDTIGQALLDKGFLGVDSRGIVSALGPTHKQGRPIIEGERIYNLGLNRRRRRSNFFVFTKVSHNKEFVRVLMADPACDQRSYGFTQDQMYFRQEIKNGDPETIARGIAEKAEQLALKKKRIERRMQVHIHSRYDFAGEKLFDDGVSGLADIVRRAALHNTDVLVFTPHNYIDPRAFAIFEQVCSLFGMTAVIGVEVTAPLTRNHVNGPHHLLMIGNPEAAREVWTKLLLQRDNQLNMQSYFRSADGNLLIDDIYRILEPLREEGLVAIGAAHPFNYNSNALPIKAVGLLSAADTGQISPIEAREHSKQLDFLEGWNRSLSPDIMQFENSELFNWISGLVHQFVYTNDNLTGAAQMREQFSLHQIMSANVCNIALAFWMEEHYKGQTTYGSDDHRTNPLTWRYQVGGDYFNAGFSFFNSEKKLTAEQIVRMIAARTLGLSSQIYAGTTSKGIQIVDPRVKYGKGLKGVAAKLKTKQTMLYAKVLGMDFVRFLNEDPKMILHMTD
jgi:hypothetical protein